MSMLQKLGTGQGHLKAGFLGFPKSGKTYTAMLLATGTRKEFGLEGAIALFDTEGGSEYIAGMVRKETGLDLMGIRSRAFDDLMGIGQDCVKEGVSVLVVDSITHVWRELCDAYLQQVNESRKKKRLPVRSRLEFQDWANLKSIWGRWTDFYLNSPLNIIICGRAGYEYDFEKDEETGRKELVKTGTKMRVESEFGFEPSLLVEMERVQPHGEGAPKMLHRATIIGDRFNLIDGKTRDNPTFEFFSPHVLALKPGAHAMIDTEIKSQIDVDDDGNVEWQRERRERTILCEEIQGELLRFWPGQTTAEKKSKAEAIEKHFGTRSWTAVENMNSDRLRSGLESLRAELMMNADKELAGVAE